MRLLLLSLAFIAACSSTSNGRADFEAKATPLAEGKGRVYVFRKSKFGGGAIRPSVKLDGIPVGKSSSGTYFYFDRAPGEYSMSCSVITKHTIRFTLKAGETKYIETRTTMGVVAGHVRPGIVTHKQGAAAASKCKYTPG